VCVVCVCGVCVCSGCVWCVCLCVCVCIYIYMVSDHNLLVGVSDTPTNRQHLET